MARTRTRRLVTTRSLVQLLNLDRMLATTPADLLAMRDLEIRPMREPPPQPTRTHQPRGTAQLPQEPTPPLLRLHPTRPQPRHQPRPRQKRERVNVVSGLRVQR